MPVGPASARAVVASTDLDGDIEFFAGLGFQLDAIWPADDPAHALVSSPELTVELRRSAAASGVPGAGTPTVVLPVDALPAAGERLRAPGGALVELVVDGPVPLPPPDATRSIVTHL